MGSPLMQGSRSEATNATRRMVAHSCIFSSRPRHHTRLAGGAPPSGCVLGATLVPCPAWAATRHQQRCIATRRAVPAHPHLRPNPAAAAGHAAPAAADVWRPRQLLAGRPARADRRRQGPPSAPAGGCREGRPLGACWCARPPPHCPTPATQAPALPAPLAASSPRRTKAAVGAGAGAGCGDGAGAGAKALPLRDVGQ